MENWAEGYVTDVSYTSAYYPEMHPSGLCLALLLRGLRPPFWKDHFKYCELGFGQGLTVNVLAAGNPQAEFWATDFNPFHVAKAAEISSSAHTRNINILDLSFAEFTELDTPTFDFIALHGVYSWISDENKKQIVLALSKKLKVGGVVYISYNSLPGWSAAMPLRHLMFEHVAGSQEPTLTKVEEGLAFATRISELEARYFTQNPGVAAHLDRIKKLSRNYVSHEYFNKDWSPQYHSDVARQLSEAKLTFAASAHLIDNIDALHLHQEAQKLLAEIGNPILRETVRDYFLNQGFRKDVFVRGGDWLHVDEQRELLKSWRFALLVHGESVPPKIALPIGEVTISEAIFKAIAEALDHEPLSLEELLELSTLRKVGQGYLLQALIALTSSGFVAPAISREEASLRRESTAKLNAAILERTRFSDEVQVLASPITGGGIGVGRLDRLFLLAGPGSIEDTVQFTWKILEAGGQKLIRDGSPIQQKEDNITELRMKAKTFQEVTKPVLVRLGIVLEAS